MGVGGSKIFAFVTIRKKPPKVKEERANGAAPLASRRSHAAYRAPPGVLDQDIDVREVTAQRSRRPQRSTCSGSRRTEVLFTSSVVNRPPWP